MKKILAAILLSSMVLSLCACGGNEGNTDKNSQNTENQAGNSQNSENSETEEDGMVTYKVTVVDEAGNPVPEVVVQICKDYCVPAVTDANGVVEFKVEDVEGYKVSFSSIPEGYESVSNETEYYFSDDEMEMTLTIKAVQ